MTAVYPRPVLQYRLSKSGSKKIEMRIVALLKQHMPATFAMSCNLAWLNNGQFLIDVDPHDEPGKAGIQALCAAEGVKIDAIKPTEHVFNFYVGFRSAARLKRCNAVWRKLVNDTFKGFHHEHVKAETPEAARVLLLEHFPDACDIRVVPQAEAERLHDDERAAA